MHTNTEQKEKDVWNAVSVSKKTPTVDTIVVKQNPNTPKIPNLPNTRSQNPWKWFFIITIVLLVLLIGILVALLMKDDTSVANKNGEDVSRTEIELLISELSQFIVLPSDPDVTLATVTDPAQLQTQAFFKNAQTGDKVLIWATTRKAILYRPSIKKIIEVSSVEVLEDGSDATEQ